MSLNLCWINLHFWGKWSNVYYKLVNQDSGLSPAIPQEKQWIVLRARICKCCGWSQERQVATRGYSPSDARENRPAAPSWGDELDAVATCEKEDGIPEHLTDAFESNVLDYLWKAEGEQSPQYQAAIAFFRAATKESGPL